MLRGDEVRDQTRSLQVGGSWPAFMLVHRLLLFLFWQATTAAVLGLVGEPTPWQASVAWWPVAALLTNLVSFGLLRFLANREGLHCRRLIGVDFRREHLGKDLLALLVVFLLAGPLAVQANLGLASLIFGDAESAVALFVQPLPRSIAWAVFLFPLTIAPVELPTYFAYAMPRLAARWSAPWMAVAVSAFWLGAQHMTLPFIPDLRFILWRVGSFIPLALLLGVSIRLRPRLLPYLMASHAVMDFPVAYMIWQASVGG